MHKLFDSGGGFRQNTVCIFLYFFIINISLSAFTVMASASALPDQALTGNMLTINDTPVPLASTPPRVLSPSAPGNNTSDGGGATVDYSNRDEGYVMVSASGGGKLKVLITRQGQKTYTFDLRSDGSWEVYPLTGGDGAYSVGVFRNVSGDQYAQLMSASFSVSLRSATLPFLYPSQFVNFNEKSATVIKGAELAGGSTDQLSIVSNVYNYVIGNISYDTDKARNVQAGYLPAVDSILASKKGICFDYAAVMCAMLRSQSIPSRLEVGYVSGGAYHAWISVYINGVGWVNNIIYFDGKSWRMMDPTFASSGNQSSGIMQFIGNGKNYSTQYVY